MSKLPSNLYQDYMADHFKIDAVMDNYQVTITINNMPKGYNSSQDNEDFVQLPLKFLPSNMTGEIYIQCPHKLAPLRYICIDEYGFVYPFIDKSAFAHVVITLAEPFVFSYSTACSEQISWTNARPKSLALAMSNIQL